MDLVIEHCPPLYSYRSIRIRDQTYVWMSTLNINAIFSLRESRRARVEPRLLLLGKEKEERELQKRKPTKMAQFSKDIHSAVASFCIVRDKRYEVFRVKRSPLEKESFQKIHSEVFGLIANFFLNFTLQKELSSRLDETDQFKSRTTCMKKSFLSDFIGGLCHWLKG